MIALKEILYSCPLDPVKLAAPGYHVISVVRELAAMGHDVTLVHQGQSIPDLEVVDQVALKLTRGNPLKILFGEVRYTIALAKELRSGKPGQCVYHRYAKWSILPFLAFFWRSAYVILEVNADLDSELKSQRRNALIRRLCSGLERIQIKYSSTVIVVSEGIRKSLCIRYPECENKIHVVENGTDIHQYFPRDKDDARAELGLEPDVKYVTFAGSLQVWQGVETLIKAAMHLKEQAADVQVLIVGDGACADEINANIKRSGLSRSVKMVGWQSGPQLALYLAASDICVAPYSSLARLDIDRADDISPALLKCSPLKIYTYMAMGKPVISSHFKDAGARLVDWGVGMSFTPDDARDLAQCIEILLRDDELRENMGQRAAARIQSEHTWRHVVSRIIGICKGQDVSGILKSGEINT